MEGWALEMKKTLWEIRDTYRQRLTMLWDDDPGVIVAWPKSMLPLGSLNGLPAVCEGTHPHVYSRDYAEILCRTVHNGHLQHPCIFTQAEYYQLKIDQIEQLLKPFLATETDPEL